MSQSIEKIKKAYTASFEGVTSHAAAAPDYGRSAFDALQLSISAVERWQKHLPERAALTYQIISSGNVAPNAPVIKPLAADIPPGSLLLH